MNLTKEQQEIYDGKQGATLAKVMQTLVRYGELFGADGMVPVTSKYNHLVTSFGLKALAPVYELMNQLIESGNVSKQKFSADPRPLDPNVPSSFLQDFVFKNFMYSKQDDYEKQLTQLGIMEKDAYTCTCYMDEVGNTPAMGEVLSWSESSAVVYANSEPKMKLKRIIALSLSAATLALSLTACGGSSSAASDNAQASDSNSGDAVTVKLGVVGSIYEDLWTPAKEKLADEGIDLEFVQFSDYVTPNNALANGEIDLNAFQHRIYLQSEIDNYGYEIENIGNTFIIPLNLYSDKVKSVDELKDGDTVAIPDDVTNGGRALKVLEAAGLIKLKDSAEFNPTIDDIETYNTKITIEELKANVIPSTLADVTAAVVNGNYALDFGLKTEDAIYKDDQLDIEEYWNLIAARSADLEDADKLETYKKVVAAFQSDETEKVFNDQFGGYFIKAGWDQDLLADK